VSMRMRFVALVALSLVVTVAWYAAAFKPSREKLSNVRAEVKTTEQEVAQLTAKLAELQALKANEAELRKEFAKFEHALPVEPAVSDFIHDVQDAADQAGIDFLSIAPSIPAAPQGAAPATSGAPTADPATSGEEAEAQAAQAAPAQPSVYSVSVSLTADGKFFEIEDFVAKMEKLERAIRIDTFTLSGGGGDTAADGAAAPAAGVGESPGVSLAIKLQMFMNRATTSAPSATSTAPTTTTTTGTGS
jgi:Tfp pilus assembly protein PilO